MSKCTKWLSCKNVPCGQSMNRCRPSYCIPNQSRNWSTCNMSNWDHPLYKIYRSTCKDESQCKLDKTRKVTRNTVDALTLHNKMPYIWRFIKPNTKKLMIKLANKPVEDINIPFDVFPYINSNKTSKKGNKKGKKHYIDKMKRGMTSKNLKLFNRLRKEYKDI